jgi:hypothetical protein
LRAHFTLRSAGVSLSPARKTHFTGNAGLIESNAVPDAEAGCILLIQLRKIYR